MSIFSSRRSFVFLILLVPATFGAEPESRATDDSITKAFQEASGGYSVDEIVIDDLLRTNWLTAVNPSWRSLGDDWQKETLLRLVSLRKAGKLAAKSAKRGRSIDEEIVPIAEIAARSVLDEHNVSSDEMLCDPRLRAQLQTAADSIAKDLDPYEIRKAILRLRKTRQLRPELVLRIVDWDRSIEVLTQQELEDALKTSDRISHGAGVYLFRDTTGYLYIGEALDLHVRLSQHLQSSDRLALRNYLDTIADGSVTIELHTFGPKSPANELAIRRAYESEMIRSREPRLNVRP